MASTGGGKMRPKRSHGSSKPYQRNRPRSFIDRVKDLVTPSWLSSMWSSSAQDESPSRGYSTRQPTSSANSIPPRQTIPDGQYFGPTEIDSEPGPLAKPLDTGRGKVGERGDEEMKTPVLVPLGGLSVPMSTSTPIDVDEDVIEVDPGEGPSTQKDDVSEVSAPPSVVSSLYPNLDRLEHQLKLSESNLDLLSEIGHRRSPMPSSGLWSHTPSGRSAITRTRPASPFNRPQQPAISTRRPAFNASYFGTPRGSSSTSSSMMDTASSSPFYPGRTTYGGASAQRSAATKRSRGSPYEVHLPIKRSVRPRLARPADESDMGITSNTAKRILDTLEKMSTPLSDAKRIPLSPSASPLAFTASRTSRLRPSASSFHRPLGPTTRGVRIPGPPVSGLSIPHTVSIAPNRQPPVPTTTASRESQRDVETDTMTSRRGNVPAPTETTGFSFKQSVSTSTSQPPLISRLDTTPVPSGGLQRIGGSGGKMRQKRSTVHYSANREDDDDDVIEVLDLPNVPLPVKTLPSFNFGKSLQPKKSTTAPSTSMLAGAAPSAGQGFRFETSTPAVSTPAAKDGDNEFIFASPILKQTASTISAPEFETTEAFTFSLPKKADLPPASTLSTSASSKPLNFVNPSSSSSLPTAASAPFKAGGFVKSPSRNGDNEGEEEEDRGFGIKAAKTLKTGSCLEVFGIVAPTDSAATTAPAAAPAVTDFAAKFRPPPGSWECNTCLLQNKASDSTCVACQAAKPTPPVSKPTPASTNTATTDLMAKFKPPEGSWECTMCLLRNKRDLAKCIACETPSPVEMQKTAQPPLNNSLLDKFRPHPGSWECATCLLQNRADADKCVACTMPKPSAAGSNPTNASDNTLTNSTAVGGFGSKTGTAKNKDTNSSVSSKVDNSIMDKFKPSAGSWNCDTCLLQNKASAERCIACETPKPGCRPSLKTPPAAAFKFGSQSTTSSSSSTAGDLKFGGASGSDLKFNPSNFNMAPGGLSFGSPKPSTDSESGGIQFGLPKDNSASGLMFGSNSDSEAQTNSLPPADAVKSGSDKFGVPATMSDASKHDDKPAVSSGFQFGAATTKSDSAPLNMDPFKATAASKTSLGARQFGVNAVSAATQETDSKAKPKQGFSFSASKDETPKLNFGSSGTEQKQTGANFTFESKAPTDSTNPPTAGQTTFQFGASSNPPATTVQQTAEKPGFKFGATPAEAPDTNKPVSASSGFSFGGTATNAVNTIQQLPHQNSVAPNFQFGKSNAGSDEAGTGQPPAKKGVTFASAIEQNQTKENKQSIGFGGAGKPSQPATQQVSPFAFGGTENKVDAPSKPNGGITFGAPVQSAAPAQSVEPFTFGAASNNSIPGSYNFSATANQNAAPASGGFQFGAVAAAPAATPAQQSQQAFGGFGSVTSTSNTFGSAFGAQPTTNSTPNPFGGQQPSQAAAPAFGAPSGTSVFGSTATPAFGAVASAGNSRSSTPTFGAAGASAAPGFGNTGTSFGTGATNSGIGFQPDVAASFNFGGGNPSSSVPGMFAFGSNNSQNAVAVPQSASTGGFNFGQQQQQPQQSGFGLQGGVQNATGPASGVFAFGANQSQTQTQTPGTTFNFGAPGIQQRKMRKAVRRARKT